MAKQRLLGLLVRTSVFLKVVLKENCVRVCVPVFGTLIDKNYDSYIIKKKSYWMFNLQNYLVQHYKGRITVFVSKLP